MEAFVRIAKMAAHNAPESSRKAAVSCALILSILLACAGSAGAFLGQPRWPAPKFPTPKIWINSKPLTLKQLRGKVVLIDFWDYTCINCIRSFPYLERWQRLYAPLGLVIIGVHTPEFNFAKNPQLVRNAVKRFGITYPIALDNSGKVWDAFHNPGWPTEYLIDKEGRVADKIEGEGNYDLVEVEIRHLLKEANPSLKFTAAKYRIPKAEHQTLFGGMCLRTTPETYLGTIREVLLVNKGGLAANKPKVYVPPKVIPIDRTALAGPWVARPDGIHTDDASRQTESSAEIHYRSKSVYIVAGSDNGSTQRLYVTQDGRPIASGARGVDIKTDWHGRTYVEIGRKQLYYLVNNPKFGKHLLRVSTSDPDVGLYSFTFGNNCEQNFPHN